MNRSRDRPRPTGRWRSQHIVLASVCTAAVFVATVPLVETNRALFRNRGQESWRIADDTSPEAPQLHANDTLKKRKFSGIEIASVFAHRLLFPSPSWSNPARRAFIRAGIDWHDLVPGDAAGNKSRGDSSSRMQRDRAKDALIALIQGFKPVRRDSFSVMREAQNILAGRLAFDAATLAAALDFDEMRQLEEFSEVVASYPEPQDVGTRVSDIYRPWWADSEASTQSEVGTEGGGNTFFGPDDVAVVRADHVSRGPLAKYAACGIVRDVCIIHTTVRACVEDELCGWCAGSIAASSSDNGALAGVCLSRFDSSWREPAAGAPSPICAGAPLWVNAASVPERRAKDVRTVQNATSKGVRVFSLSRGSSGPVVASASLSACDVLVTRRRPLRISIMGNSKMAYHFWTESASALMQSAAAEGGLQFLRQHAWVDDSSVPEFTHFAALFSDSCWRPVSSIPPRLCYEDVEKAPGARVVIRFTEKGEASQGPSHTTSQIWTGLLDPELAAVEPGSGKWIPEPHVQQPALETVATAVRRGMRLGVTGMAAALRSVARNVGNAARGDIQNIRAAALLPPYLMDRIDDQQWVQLSPSLARLATEIEGGARGDLVGYIVATLGLWSTSERDDVAPASDSTQHVSLPDATASQVLQERRASRRPSIVVRQPKDTGASQLCSKPLVVLISRRNKRFLLNEPALITALYSLPSPPRVLIAALEDMPLYAQVTLLRRTTLLIAVHGSALINSIMMRQNGRSAVLQLMPYRVTGGADFFRGPAESRGVRYAELTHSSENGTLRHWHFVGGGGSNVSAGATASRREAVLRRCGGNGDRATWFSFCINADMAIDAQRVARATAKLLEDLSIASSRGCQ